MNHVPSFAGQSQKKDISPIVKHVFFGYESCTFFCRAATKERRKSHCKTNKIYERCVLFRSVMFCPTYHQCPHFRSKSACRGETELVLENVGCTRGQFQDHKNPQGKLHSVLMKLTNFDQVSSNKQWLCTSTQKQLPPSKHYKRL